MVVLVRDDEAAHLVDADAGRPVKLAGPVSLRTELVVQRAVPVVDLDPVVAPVGHHNVTFPGATDAPRPAQISVSGSFLAELQQGLPDIVVVATRPDHATERAVADLPE